MHEPSPSFRRSLEILDPLLNIRWGEVIGSWVIERKAIIPESEVGFLIRREGRTNKLAHEESPKKKNVDIWRGVSEELISAKRGYRVILFTPHLSPKVYNDLCLGDIQRYGGYSRYADELEAAEQKRLADKERMAENTRLGIHNEVHSMLNFIWRKKEDMLLNGERSLYRLLEQNPNEPLIKPE